ncbi:putative cell cycle sequence binding phosphoprotein (RBP33) [Trypanosoma theileri]|uniref:Putative cell cycle sequence binding phosphoprotein (RBP33) n=1 Tax=Trypanosoma theileri TaxID=67003 RepID=A0A1X0NUF7_9TRYP|nr:putative cell cycle sequence binding phosphoprotein (RBP33) [Trypanosoma theileri]ORC88325.1 putative cell cycle sequence binding phosphoprotein (RBP33) [Trypanosoma theileri]
MESSFQDVTNVVPTKRRIPSQHIMQMSEGTNVAMMEELSEKVDHLSEKIDAMYEMLLSLMSQHQQQQQVSTMPAASPVMTQLQSRELDPPTPVKEERHVASFINNPTQQHQDTVPSCAVLEDFQPPAITGTLATVPAANTITTTTMNKDAEFKNYNQKKSPVNGMTSTPGRVADLNNWAKRDCFILIVEFKCQRVKRCESSVFITPGQYAIVQGDRGHDCGVVNQCSEWSVEKGCFVREESFDGNLVNVSRMKGELGRVLRVATEEEVERLFGEIARNENLALRTCREIVARLGLDMDVVDCEYQFDQQKISFYYEASRSIDFRHLNSELYRIFGVRIWLQNVNNAVKNVVPAGAMSRDDKVQYQKSGLRPPTFR